MNSTLSEWLALREAADWTARSDRLVQRLREALASSETVRGLDLCTGTGSNLRYLMDRLPQKQRWLVVDTDGSLLDEVPMRLQMWAGARNLSVRTDWRVSHIRGRSFDCDIETRQMDLDRLHPEIFDGRNLVTASALLDLVSESWLRLLASRCRTVGASALFSITYDGRWSCDPAEPEDDVVRELMNLHQKTDKGLGGLAAGPDAGIIAARVFREAGFCVECASSDWQIEPSQQPFQRMLIEGWAHAAGETAPSRANVVGDWLQRRLGHLEAGRSRIIVHHADVVAWLGHDMAGVSCAAGWFGGAL
jgi:hypothetical protein